MSFGALWPNWLAWLLSAFFAVNGVVNVVGPRSMREGFARWGYPPWFHVFNGVLQLAIGFLIAFPSTRMVGLGVGALICVAVFITLIRHHEAAHLPPSIVLLLLVLAAAIGMQLS
jgi:succinate dehydrogenase/fumarate reductase cytochrome b subunit